MVTNTAIRASFRTADINPFDYHQDWNDFCGRRCGPSWQRVAARQLRRRRSSH